MGMTKHARKVRNPALACGDDKIVGGTKRHRRLSVVLDQFRGSYA
jgi:hypothetical protein